MSGVSKALQKKFQALLFSGITWLMDQWPWFGKKINKIMINYTVNKCRHRPHPWSTVYDYVSWRGLTDKTWSARHLPAKQLRAPEEDLTVECFRRTEMKYCASSTCLFPAFAQYLTDSFIRTKMPKQGEPDDPTRKQNTSNHEIDMSPLYGRTHEQTEALRLLSNKSGEKGKLKSQTIDSEEFAPFLYGQDGSIKREFAILDLPLMSDKLRENKDIVAKIFAFGGDRANASPQVAMMNTLFLREHNRIAGLLEKHHADWDDDHVFEVGRNIVIALFLNIVIEEYINHIASSFKFTADPSVGWDAAWNKPNWITTEFSLLYRFHQLIPDKLHLGGKDYSVAQTIMNNQLLLSTGLKQAFLDMSNQRAGQIGPLNTPEALLHLEALAIKQGRMCELASYSDYREYASLSRPKKFADISTNPEIIKLLEQTYHSVDDVEFYVGLFAEDRDTSSPLPPLLRTMVAVDAFSQIFTNPLMSKHVYNVETFTKEGMEIINQTSSMRDIVQRNVAGGLSETDFVGMTRQS